MGTKKIKVSYIWRCTGSRYLHGSRYSAYPKLQMQGKWLEELGFQIGDTVTVEYEEGCIKISPAKKHEAAMVAESPAEYRGSSGSGKISGGTV